MRADRAILSGAALTALIWSLGAGAGFAQSTAAASASASPAANPTAASELGGVVVTARRVAERLQDVPLSVTAVSAGELQTLGITDLQSLAKFTPSLQFKDFVTSFHGNPVIRGMTQINTANPVTNVGVFVDGVNLPRDYQLNLSLGDFERIEVVKGPQSALYGANTFAGAINYVTRQPTNDYSGNASATLGDAGEQRFEAAFGGPILKDILDARIYVGSDKYDGTRSNNLPGATGEYKHFDAHDRRSYSGALRFTPTSNLTLDGYYSHTERTEGQRPYYTVSGSFKEDRTNCGAINSVTGVGQLFCGTFATDPSPYRTGIGSHPTGLYSNVQPDALSQTDILKFGAQWAINSAFTLAYTLGATRGSASEDFSFFSNTYDPSPRAIGGVASFSQQIEGGQVHNTTHEVRLIFNDGKPYTFEVGYYHADVDDRYFLGIVSVPITGGIVPPFVRASTSPLYVAPGVIPLTSLDEKFATNAGFFRATYNFLDDRATVSAEFRYTATDLIYNDLAARTRNPALPMLKSSYSDPIPRITAEYKLTRNNLLYASAAEGIKTGGFNGYVSGTVSLLTNEQSFGEEKNWTYEVGSKNSFFNHTLVLNADFFYIDWPDKQSSVAPSNLPPNTTGALTTVANIYKLSGSATNYGVEVEGHYRPIPPLTINFAFTAEDPTYGSGSKNTAFVGYCTVGACPIDGTISGNQIERQSQLSGTLGVEYRDHLKGDWDYFGALDGTYQSMQYTDQENLGKIAGYGLANLQLGFESDRYRAFFYVKNLADKSFVDNVFYVQSQKQYTAVLGERRTFGVTVSGKF